MADLSTPLARAAIPGLTPTIASALAKRLDLHTVRDLLEHVPRRYMDLSQMKKIAELKIGEEATVVGAVARVDARRVRSGRHLLSVRVSDGTGHVEGVWWNQPFRAKHFSPGMPVMIAGKLERKMGKLSISNPFVESLRGGGEGGVHTARIIPIHPATERVGPNQIRRFAYEAVNKYAHLVPEPLPASVLAGRDDLMDRPSAISQIHFPDDERRRQIALHRLVFEELFVLSAGLAMRKRRVERETVGIVHTGGEDAAAEFLDSLPFEATGAQRRAIDEIAADLALPRPMNRLLQGEVGSGKTVVAVAAALLATGSGSQTALMAPTEVLAEQHYLSIRRMLDAIADAAPAGEGRLFGGGWQVALLTGSMGAKERAKALDAAASGEATIVIGTHALIQEGVAFNRLGLAIVDEQHRFGVHQRVALRSKTSGEAEPDVLIMTATPIPRTIALTLYGDLDVSVLDEMPKGRTPVKTLIADDDEKRAKTYGLIRSEVEAGRQAFIVCPLVAESETLEVKSAESEFERISAEVYPDLRVGLLHGRMRPQDKDRVMRSMRAGEIDVLVATTVIEVGVDVPNATVMLIEDADRFGLSQLHQLRGRVGRGEHAAWCILATSLTGDEEERELAQMRMKAMASTTDGFALAEEDLRIRGEGQIFGRGRPDEDATGGPFQAGRTDLKFARLLRHQKELADARRAAFAVVDADPSLSRPENAALLDEVKRRFADRLDWLFAS